MDAPQWYNSRLWNTSKQSIDGKPLRPSGRPQSASVSNFRQGLYSQSLLGSWSTPLRATNMALANRDQGFTFRFVSPHRQSRSAINKLSSNFSSRYYDSLSSNFNFSMRNNHVVGTAPVFSVRPRSSSASKAATSSSSQSSLQKFFDQVSTLPNPVVAKSQKENKPINRVDEAVQDDEDSDQSQETDPRHSAVQELKFTKVPEGPTAPHNTPRLFSHSSLTTQPKKSILKKTNTNSEEPSVPIFSISNAASLPRNLSVSSKSLVISQRNNFLELRKSLHSAPGTKREVRFDITTNDIFEYSPYSN